MSQTQRTPEKDGERERVRDRVCVLSKHENHTAANERKIFVRNINWHKMP